MRQKVLAKSRSHTETREHVSQQVESVSEDMIRQGHRCHRNDTKLYGEVGQNGGSGNSRKQGAFHIK